MLYENWWYISFIILIWIKTCTERHLPLIDLAQKSLECLRFCSLEDSSSYTLLNGNAFVFDKSPSLCFILHENQYLNKLMINTIIFKNTTLIHHEIQICAFFSYLDSVVSSVSLLIYKNQIHHIASNKSSFMNVWIQATLLS